VVLAPRKVVVFVLPPVVAYRLIARGTAPFLGGWNKGRLRAE
jgi:hypothetical protein